MTEVIFVDAASQMGGVEFSTLYLTRSLDRTRWRPLVICPEEGELPRRCREAKVEVAIVPRSRFFSTGIRLADRTVVNPLALASNSVSVLASTYILARFFRGRKPNLVVTKGLLSHFYGGLAARLVRIPCVWHVQDRVSERPGPFFAWAMAIAGRLLAREIIVDAESIARQFRPLVSRGKISVVWNGVDLNEFAPNREGSTVRAEWNAGAGETLIGVIGRLTPWKGQEVLIQAFAKIADRFPRARVMIIGSPLFESDDYQRKLIGETERLGLSRRICFAGFRSDLPQVLGALDLVVHSALEKDSSPLAVVSAMAAGKPIICTRVDGTAELFQDGVDALLVTPGDAAELAEKLALLLSDEGLAKRLGEAARRKAERELSLERFTSSCERVFDRALQ